MPLPRSLSVSTVHTGVRVHGLDTMLSGDMVLDGPDVRQVAIDGGLRGATIWLDRHTDSVGSAVLRFRCRIDRPYCGMRGFGMRFCR